MHFQNAWGKFWFRVEAISKFEIQYASCALKHISTKSAYFRSTCFWIEHWNKRFPSLVIIWRLSYSCFTCLDFVLSSNYWNSNEKDIYHNLSEWQLLILNYSLSFTRSLAIYSIPRFFVIHLFVCGSTLKFHFLSICLLILPASIINMMRQVAHSCSSRFSTKRKSCQEVQVQSVIKKTGYFCTSDE